MKSRAIAKAELEYENAAKKLCAIVLREYPVGKRLIIELGGNRIYLDVEGHNDYWWFRPGEMYGRNINTGKTRKFMASDVVFAEK